jgi:hypothetical protein
MPTPTMVPFSLFAAAEGAAAAGWGAVGRAAAGAAGEAGGFGRAGGVFISIVPLNFGADAPFKLKLHLLQVMAASGF